MRTYFNAFAVILFCLILINIRIGFGPYLEDIELAKEPKDTSPDALMLRECKLSLRQKLISVDFVGYSKVLRLLKTYWETYNVLEKNLTSSKETDQMRRNVISCYEKLEEFTLPWIKSSKFNNLVDLANYFNNGQRGVVISSYNKYFDYTVHLIKGLKWLSFNIPIVIAFAGDDDLSVERQKYFNSMNISTIDLTRYFNNEIIELTGFAIKPFAVLAAPFEEVMLLDCDTVFLKSPAKMFDDEEYLKTGLLLQKDRSFHHELYKQRLWLLENLPKPLSKSITESLVFQGHSDHQVDSSLLVINKRKQLFSLLTACKLNMPVERRNFYEHFYGDKESFWFGPEMMFMNTSFLPYDPGVFGRFKDGVKHKLCGRQLMFDREGEPFYFNEAIVWHKQVEEPERRGIMEIPTHYDYAARWFEEGENRCLYAKGIPFERELLDKFEILIDFYKHVKL